VKTKVLREKPGPVTLSPPLTPISSVMGFHLGFHGEKVATDCPRFDKELQEDKLALPDITTIAQ
jgi:hypothetical protein